MLDKLNVFYATEEDAKEARNQIIDTFEAETTKALQDLLEAKYADLPFALPKQNLFHAKEVIAELVSEFIYEARV